MLVEQKNLISKISELTQYALCVIILMIYLSQGTIFSPTNVNYLAFVLTFFLFIHTAFLIYIRKSIYMNNFGWLFFGALFTVYVAVRFKFETYYQYPDFFAYQIIYTFILAFGFSQCLKDKKLIRISVFLLILFYFFQVFYGFYQRYFLLPKIYEQSQNPEYVKAYFSGLVNDHMFMQRLLAKLPYGSLTYPNAWAALLGGGLLCMVFILIELIKNKKKSYASMVFILLLIVGWALFISDAKGVWICCLLISVFITIWQLPFIQKLSKLQWIAVFGFASLMTGVFFNYLIWPMLSFQVRWNYWLAGWKMYLDQANYFFGIGSGQFSLLYSKYKVAEGWEVKKPHNYFFYLLIEQGIVGVSLFLTFFMSAFWAIFKKKIINEQDESKYMGSLKWYNIVFYASFIVYCILLPVVDEDIYSSSVLNTLFAFYLIIVCLIRFLKFQKIHQLLPFELGFTSILVLFLGNILPFIFCWLPLLMGQNEWIYTVNGENTLRPHIEALIYLFSIASLLIFILIFKASDDNKSVLSRNSLIGTLVQNRVYALLILLYITVQLFTDMVAHFQAIPIVFIVCFIMYNSAKGERVMPLPKFWNVSIYFSLLSVSLFLFSFMVRPAYAYYIAYSDFEITKKSNVPKLNQVMVVSKLIEKYPKSIDFQFFLADLFHVIARYYESEGQKVMRIEYLQKSYDHWNVVSKIYPQLARPYAEMAYLLEEANKLDPVCVDMYLEAIARYPLKGEYHLNLGKAYLRLGKYEKAIASFEEVDRIQKLSDKQTRVSKEEYEKLQKTVLDLKRIYDKN